MKCLKSRWGNTLLACKIVGMKEKEVLAKGTECEDYSEEILRGARYLDSHTLEQLENLPFVSLSFSQYEIGTIYTHFTGG